MPFSHQLKPGEPINLAETPTSAQSFHTDRAEAELEFKALRNELVELQLRMYAEGKHKLLIVLQAMDAAGKEEARRTLLAVMIAATGERQDQKNAATKRV